MESDLCGGFIDTHFPTESIAFSISDIFSNFFGPMKNTKNFGKFLENNLTPRAKRARKKSGIGPFYKGETCFKVTNLGVPKRSHIITPLQLLENLGK